MKVCFAPRKHFQLITFARIMEDKTTLFKQLKEYTARFNNEQSRIEALTTFLKANDEARLYDRKNFEGHITASAFVVNDSRNALLMIKHKALNRWLQPGGHVETADEFLISAALREAIEETGIPTDKISPVYPHIFDVDSHAIPANPKKNEPAHVHHDIRFLFKYSSASELEFNADEVTAAKWISIDEVLKYPDFQIVVNKVIEYKIS